MKVTCFSGCILLVICLIQGHSFAQQVSDVSAMMVDIRGTIDSIEEEGFKILIPGIVRMVFHYCIDGCDACLNLGIPPNSGIDRTVNALEVPYQKYKDIISRADFWALASKVALEMSVDLNNARCSEESCMAPEINIRFKTGRTDCETSPTHDENTFIPSPFSTAEVLMPWFKEQFGFSPNNVVAIMGLHTLGKVSPPMNRAWESENRDGFSNVYYQRIVDANHCWVQEYLDPQLTGLRDKQFFWRTGDFKGFALPIDMTLFKNIQVDSPTGESSCSYYDCGNAKTVGMFRRYARDLPDWTKRVEKLFPRIIEKTENKLRFPSN